MVVEGGEAEEAEEAEEAVAGAACRCRCSLVGAGRAGGGLRDAACLAGSSMAAFLYAASSSASIPLRLARMSSECL